MNAAGISGAPHNAIDFSDEAYDAVMHINLRAPFLLTRAIGNHMIERGGGGRIVNVSSSAAFRATPSPAIYAASKAGLCGLTRSAAADLGMHDINVNAVAFGFVETRLTASNEEGETFSLGDVEIPLGIPERNRERAGTVIALGRGARPEEAAGAIFFLCSPWSNFVQGQVLTVNGGQMTGMT